MRAALLTTVVVLAILFAWANWRGERRRPESMPEPAEAPAAAPLPDVAAAPAGAAGAAPSEGTPAPQADATYEPATAQPARGHVVAAGETLADIAQRYYGDPARADEIYAANRDRIRDPEEQLHAGQTLVIP